MKPFLPFGGRAGIPKMRPNEYESLRMKENYLEYKDEKRKHNSKNAKKLPKKKPYGLADAWKDVLDGNNLAWKQRIEKANERKEALGLKSFNSWPYTRKHFPKAPVLPPPLTEEQKGELNEAIENLIRTTEIGWEAPRVARDVIDSILYEVFPPDPTYDLWPPFWGIGAAEWEREQKPLEL